MNSSISTLNSNKANVTQAIKNITRSGTTFTATRTDDTTFTFTQQDTTYSSGAIVAIKSVRISGTYATFGSYNQSTAASLSGYSPLFPIMVATVGWIGSCYAYPNGANGCSTVWVAAGSGSGSIDVYWLMCRNGRL